MLVSPSIFPFSPSHILPGHPKDKSSALPHPPTAMLCLPSIPETEPASYETETSETMSQVNNLSSFNLFLLCIHNKDKQQQQQNPDLPARICNTLQALWKTVWQFLRLGTTSSPHEPRQTLSHEDLSACPRQSLREMMSNGWSIPNESQFCGIGCSTQGMSELLA